MCSILWGSEHSGYNPGRCLLCSQQVSSVPDECGRNYTPQVKHTLLCWTGVSMFSTELSINKIPTIIYPRGRKIASLRKQMPNNPHTFNSNNSTHIMMYKGWIRHEEELSTSWKYMLVVYSTEKKDVTFKKKIFSLKAAFHCLILYFGRNE